jgi:alpha-galactosidase
MIDHTLLREGLPVLSLVLAAILFPVGLCTAAGGDKWQDRVLRVPYAAPDLTQTPGLQLIRQDYEKLEINRSVIETPMKIGARAFAHGLGTHSVSFLRVHSPEPIRRFSAWVGVDHNERTAGGLGSVVFVVTAGDAELFRSGIMRGGQEPVRVDIDAKGARALDLHVEDAGDGPACDHADWAEAAIETEDGKTLRLDELKEWYVPAPATRYPFSFTYGGKASDDLLGEWKRETATAPRSGERLYGTAEGETRTDTTWTDPATGLRLTWEVTRFGDYEALEWVLYFENSGQADTPIIENVQAMDIAFDRPMPGPTPYRLHKTNGAPANETDYEVSDVTIDEKHSEMLGGGEGRSSNKDLPFYKIDMDGASAIVAVGWSGQWQSRIECPDRHQLHLTSGLELTHFRLHPGEKVRSPRMLVFLSEGDSLEANARFRQLIYKHYAALRNGEKPLPTLFCNTCFTRGGGWLNECNAENQISLIKAYAPMGLQALITDAGWFEGGWPAGAGNWTPRKDAYPQGMGPVAAAAKANGMVYGLWYEPERVVPGTWVHRNHPEWCLSAGDPYDQSARLLDFGKPEVQDYFFGIVKGFMDLPGFRFYRQDFNMDPLPYWRHNDAPDRQGMTEIKYIEGLYAYWDRLAKAWPDAYREECASGGRRIDLETIMRFHIHQDSDFWFHDDVDQAQTWGLAQYLPNNLFTTPLIRLDDYSFHSTLPTSLCMGWIADEPGFDTARGKKLLERYRALRRLVIGAWYPLLPYTRSPRDWMASQYHRPDLGEGMILAYRHAESPYRSVDVKLHGLDAGATYELRWESTGHTRRATGAELMQGLVLEIGRMHGSESIVYRKV